MITISTSTSLDDTTAIRHEVDNEIAKMNDYLRVAHNMHPLTRQEAYMLREYLHAKLRGRLEAP